MKKGLYLIVAIVLSVGSFEFVKRTFKEFYYLRNFEYKRASTSSIIIRNSIDADVSYDYTFEYQYGDRHFSFEHIAKSDLGYKKGDSVTIRVSQVNKNYATFKSYDQQLLDLLLVIVIIILLIVFWVKVIFAFREKPKRNIIED
ncbi:hypothetical protein ESA94_03360 [Lacibacter luteus]|uniref:DUF3592 domain-containing protein n=1 Tax=Lacibacter luteus TaxID=2508719 RepID=A0A4V1M7Z4_9BACT|nr:hypothetical protein [Lacibacter luteus]RXK62062.1 hypothetical protein ESA94_03360 [Lacibacter luteus]